MIHESAHNLESNGFQIIKRLTDDDGAIGYWLSRDDEQYVLVAKEYAFRGLASFMEELVKGAARRQLTLLFYENENETYTVFDAEYYAENGSLSTGMSKTRDTRWLELPLKEGASLSAYLSGADSPATLAGDNSTLGSFA